MLNIKDIKKEFPILNKNFNNLPLIYLDNAATTQKPNAVINSICDYYQNQNANVGRSVYSLSILTNRVFEGARQTIQQFINAASPEEIVYTKGVTDSINLIAETFGKTELSKGDEIIISELEHHSNICPWQKLCAENGFKLKIAPVDESGDLNLNAFRSLLNKNTKIVAITHVSNVTGTVLPLKTIIKEAHSAGAKVLVDGAQGAAHNKVDVQELNCDFYCISGHKMYGPMGIGVLYGKKELLYKLNPYQHGGGIVLDVSYDEVKKYKNVPHIFEAGTPDVAGVIGLEASAKFLMQLGLENVYRHEKKLTQYANKQLSRINGIKFFGNPQEQSSIISFLIENIHPYDVGNHLNKFGVCVRTGVHCAIPYIDKLGIVGTVRLSFGIYNDESDVDKMCDALMSVKKGEWTKNRAKERM
ncbi:MAG: cysteine desulfurase [bacterium]|nr:cysteine desulfurase [bacterium]